MFTRLLLPALLCLGATAAIFAGDQPQWGQRHSRNMVSDEKGLPAGFDPKTGKNVKWTVPLGSKTYGTPIVAGGKILIGTNNEPPRDANHMGDRGVLQCLNESDGKLCWQLIVPKRSHDRYEDWPRVGICSPPTVEGDRVYVLTSQAHVVCLDLKGLANGNDGPVRDEGKRMAPAGAAPEPVSKTDADILWAFDVPRQAGIHPHDSAHASILIDGNFLYLNTGNGVDNTHHKIRKPDGPSLIVLDKRTGALVAQDNERIGPHIVHATWSSPAMGIVGGRPLVFFGGGNGVVYAFNPLKKAAAPAAMLKKVWSFDCDPTAPKENIHDYMGNRTTSPSHIKGMPVFHKGRVYVASTGDIWWGKREASLKCIDASGAGDVTKSAQVWSQPLTSHCCATPSIRDGLVYIGDCGRTVHCFDAETGKPVWTHETDGDIWGSTLVADGKVYVGTRRGGVWIFAAGREKKVLASVKLDGPIHGTPTAANGVIYIATMKRLYAFHSAKSD